MSMDDKGRRGRLTEETGLSAYLRTERQLHTSCLSCQFSRGDSRRFFFVGLPRLRIFLLGMNFE